MVSTSAWSATALSRIKNRLAHTNKKIDSVQYSMRQIFKTLVYWVALFAFVAILATLAQSIRIYRSYDIGDKNTIMNRRDTGLMIYDRTGTLFFAFNRARPRIFIPLASVPLHTQQAIIAAEDKDFFSHHGFSIRGMVRSLYLDIKQKEIRYGGSTITQQLVKNSLLTPEKTITRKFQEIIIAIKLERNFSKKEILEMYINSAYFGEGVFGVEAAAAAYFTVEAKALTLAQSAILAGLMPAPAAYEPKERQHIVLGLMEEQGYITTAQHNAALKEHVVFQKQPDDINKTAPHFALMVKEEVDRMYGEENVIRMGMKVTTTLDVNWQQYAEETLKTHVVSLRSGNVGNGAAVILDPQNGNLRALVGSVDWFQEQYGKANMATSPRQTGSAFKPIVYATALEEKVVTAATILQDRPTTFIGNYQPKDYDNKWRGPVTVRRALANSLNVPAVETIIKTGIPNVVALAKKLGISTIRDNAIYNPSTALGAENITLLDLTSAYGVFANHGILHKPNTIMHIKNKYDQDIVFKKKPAIHVLDERVAFIISSILSDANARAEIFGKLLTISRSAAVKTGTTQDYRDGWTIGYTPNLAVGVWIGNNDNTSMYRTPASIGAAPLWKLLMEHYLAELPNEEFAPPAGIAIRPSCYSRGIEYFLPGTEFTQRCLPKPSPTTLLTPL
ncbi:MAG TPA: PBP1A family penicillin-binding protein [Candidatus Andersenbacteria bacterium]|nr:PBP1A family penicillin-binding protein [Candidatus Andersenbacteria bacterium]